LTIEIGADFPLLDAGRGLGLSAKRLRNSRMKRALDIVGAALGLVILAPFLLLIALLIKLDSPGPVLFRQRRTGFDGKVFSIYKFRTMGVLEDGPNVVPARKGDERTTRLGRFLRRSSIDELPQLFNVLQGDMSLVGPRPHAVAHDKQFAAVIPTYTLRFVAKPGITGLAQVAGFRGEIRDGAHMEERVERDLEYIANWSLLLDIKILILTLISVPFHEQAY